MNRLRLFTNPIIQFSLYIAFLCISIFAAFEGPFLFVIAFMFSVLSMIQLCSLCERSYVLIALSITLFLHVLLIFFLGPKFIGGLAVLFTVVGAYYIFWFLLDRSLRASRLALEIVEKEKRELSAKYDIKTESLSSLEFKVDEIFKLFEMAKDFNECLHFPGLIELLMRKVIKDFSLVRGGLAVFEGRKRKQSIFTVFKFDEAEWLEAENDERFDFDKMLGFFSKDYRALTVDHDTLAQHDFVLDSEAVKLPVCFFPLVVEDKMIGVFFAEGGNADVFSKCSIIAGQLALQIKKINLYHTVKELSITDGLTGVFVRRHFLERFNEELKRSIKNNYKLCVIMLDIDYFKSYNDTFGHLVGDVTLREVSRIIKESVRKVDLISRYGGEEFAIVLPETDLVGGVDAAERIRSAVAGERFSVYDEETRVTVSIGVASFPENMPLSGGEFYSDLAFDLLHKADQALYKAKQAGRNRVVAAD